ncbi:MAG: hypothetical protein PHV37_08175 [Candidatus Gastranaerophilales bacterium]|nr:hypothetical protein [Candidatus Gastranaerophilales bacterium]
MVIDLPKYEIKTGVRAVKLGGLNIGSDRALSYMSENSNSSKPYFALEIPFFDLQNEADAIKNAFDGCKSFDDIFHFSENLPCDIICISFDFDEEKVQGGVEAALPVIKDVVKNSTKPIILKGCNNKNVDKILLKELALNVKTPCVIAFAEESTYSEIVPAVIKNNHILALRSPIDINLAKELNILTEDLGLKTDKILIDPDLGALGYGLDYGYSIIEKIKEAGLSGDEMLNMPIISFVGEETFKVKEAKSDKYDANWGDYGSRALMWEIATAGAIISAGANVVVLKHPKSVEILKETIWN